MKKTITTCDFCGKEIDILDGWEYGAAWPIKISSSLSSQNPLEELSKGNYQTVHLELDGCYSCSNKFARDLKDLIKNSITKFKVGDE